MITVIKREGDASLFVQLLICVCELCVYLLLLKAKLHSWKEMAWPLGSPVQKEIIYINSFLSSGADLQLITKEL